jgi:hypothetical protein
MKKFRKLRLDERVMSNDVWVKRTDDRVPKRYAMANVGPFACNSIMRIVHDSLIGTPAKKAATFSTEWMLCREGDDLEGSLAPEVDLPLPTRRLDTDL